MSTVEAQSREIVNSVNLETGEWRILRLRKRQIPLGWTSTMQLPYTICCAMPLFVLLLLIVVGFVLRSRMIGTEPIYPLAAFEAIQPGQSATLLADYDCQPAAASNYGESQSCEIFPDDPLLVQNIQISINDGDIQSALYTLSGLPWGYLKLRWGHPELVQIRERFFVVRWQSGIYARGRLSGDFSYAASVYMLSFRQT